MEVSLHAPMVLLAEPAPQAQRLLRAALSEHSVRIKCASSGREVLELCAQEPPAALFLSLALSQPPGLVVLERLKKDVATSHIPIIALAPDGSPEIAVQAIEVGAMTCLKPPYYLPELRARLRSALALSDQITRLERSARLDPLTGLWNRGYFTDRLDADMAEAARANRPIAVAMADLDHFKDINDSYGHIAGDVILKRFAEVLTAQLRRGDTACRYGGEEFALILNGAGLEQAAAVCRRIHTAVAQTNWSDLAKRPVTVSLGVSGCGVDGRRDAASWVEAADRALYEAKAAGRNCTKIYAGPAPGMRLAG